MAQPIRQTINAWDYFSKEITKLIKNINDDIVPLYGVSEITPEIFVYAALENTDSMLYKSVNGYLNSIDINKIHDEIGTKHIHQNGIIGGKPEINRTLNQLFNQAYNEKSNTQSKYITSDHVLLAILNTTKSDILRGLFEERGLTYNILLDLCKNIHNVTTYLHENEEKLDEDDDSKTNGGNPIKIIEINGNSQTGQDLINNMFGGMLPPFMKPGMMQQTKQTSSKKSSKNIDYCTNLNQKYASEEIEPTYGMDDEINEIYRILSRCKCNNALIVGEPGVGKTQCVLGLVKKLIDGDVPLQFMNKEILKFNVGELIAGTTLRGMLEDRIVNLVKQLKNNKNAILFVDDLDTLFADKRQESEMDSGGVLRDLFNGDKQVIATVSYGGLKSLEQSIPDILKKFQKVVIEPPTKERSVDILCNIRKYYEKHHNVKYTDEIIWKTVELSAKYITDKCLPSSAIDIIDELGAYKKVNSLDNERVKHYNKELVRLQKEKDEKIKEDKIDECEYLDEQLNICRNQLANLLSNSYRGSKQTITLEDLYTVISQHTKIPVSKVSKTEKETIRNIDKVLKERIIGQDEAIDAVSKAIKRNKLGLSSDTHPVCSVLCVGTTGVGKTMLAKTLAKEIFGDEKYLVRFDMSEYSDETAINKLIGANAGYVGYTDGGLLTEAVKNKKYCVLLFDEIEKANAKVYNLFLQILDDGFITDNMGNKIDFKNCAIIMTSNVGTKKAYETKTIGFNSEETSREDKLNTIKKEMKKHFPPEFINRLDDILFFNTLTEENLTKIVSLELKLTCDKFIKNGYTITYDNSVIECLMKSLKTEKEYGARPVKRIIREQIENQIVDMILNVDLNNEFNVTTENDCIVIKQ